MCVACAHDQTSGVLSPTQEDGVLQIIAESLLVLPDSLLMGELTDAVRLGTTIVLADRVQSRLIALDEAGTVIWTYGRPGRGPDEFSGLQSIASVNESTFAVLDGDQRAISVLSRTGMLIRRAAAPAGVVQGLSSWPGDTLLLAGRFLGGATQQAHCPSAKPSLVAVRWSVSDGAIMAAVCVESHGAEVIDNFIRPQAAALGHVTLFSSGISDTVTILDASSPVGTPLEIAPPYYRKIDWSEGRKRGANGFTALVPWMNSQSRLIGVWAGSGKWLLAFRHASLGSSQLQWNWLDSGRHVLVSAVGPLLLPIATFGDSLEALAQSDDGAIRHAWYRMVTCPSSQAVC
jgi:hypothetical protein